MRVNRRYLAPLAGAVLLGAALGLFANALDLSDTERAVLGAAVGAPFAVAGLLFAFSRRSPRPMPSGLATGETPADVKETVVNGAAKPFPDELEAYASPLRLTEPPARNRLDPVTVTADDWKPRTLQPVELIRFTAGEATTEAIFAAEERAREMAPRWKVRVLAERADGTIEVISSKASGGVVLPVEGERL